jgi:hypothetical protein
MVARGINNPIQVGAILKSIEQQAIDYQTVTAAVGADPTNAKPATQIGHGVQQ